MKDDGRFSLFRIGYINIYRADLNTMITPVASLRIEYNRLIGCCDIGEGEEFFPGHIFLPPIKSCCYSDLPVFRKKGFEVSRIQGFEGFSKEVIKDLSS
jgi:hypothetical protein